MQEKKPPADLLARTKQFALRIIRMYSQLPKTEVGRVLRRQVLRSGTSIGAHYREGRRGRSTAEFVAKMELAVQELLETHYWLELIVEGDLATARRMTPLMDETNELIAILTASAKKAKRRPD